MPKSPEYMQGYRRRKKEGTFKDQRFKFNKPQEEPVEVAWRREQERQKERAEYWQNEVDSAINRVLGENALDASRYQYGEKDSRYNAVKDATDELLDRARRTEIDYLIDRADKLTGEAMTGYVGASKKATQDYYAEYKSAYLGILKDMKKRSYRDKYGHLQIK